MMEFLVLFTVLTLANIIPVEVAADLTGKFNGKAPVPTRESGEKRQDAAPNSLIEALEVWKKQG